MWCMQPGRGNFMKIQIHFIVSSALFLTGGVAQADLSALLKDFNLASGQAASHIEYLMQNAQKCTVYAHYVRKGFKPLLERVRLHAQEANAAYAALMQVSRGHVSLRGDSCVNFDLSRDTYAVNMQSHLQAEARFQSILNELKFDIKKLMDYDSKLKEAFAAGDPNKYPQCSEVAYPDKQSNPESQYYKGLKAQLNQMLASFFGLRGEIAAERQSMQGLIAQLDKSKDGCGSVTAKR